MNKKLCFVTAILMIGTISLMSCNKQTDDVNKQPNLANHFVKNMNKYSAIGFGSKGTNIQPELEASSGSGEAQKLFSKREKTRQAGDYIGTKPFSLVGMTNGVLENISVENEEGETKTYINIDKFTESYDYFFFRPSLIEDIEGNEYYLMTFPNTKGINYGFYEREERDEYMLSKNTGKLYSFSSIWNKMFNFDFDSLIDTEKKLYGFNFIDDGLDLMSITEVDNQLQITKICDATALTRKRSTITKIESLEVEDTGFSIHQVNFNNPSIYDAFLVDKYGNFLRDIGDVFDWQGNNHKNESFFGEKINIMYDQFLDMFYTIHDNAYYYLDETNKFVKAEGIVGPRFLESDMSLYYYESRFVKEFASYQNGQDYYFYFPSSYIYSNDFQLYKISMVDNYSFKIELAIDNLEGKDSRDFTYPTLDKSGRYIYYISGDTFNKLDVTTLETKVITTISDEIISIIKDRNGNVILELRDSRLSKYYAYLDEKDELNIEPPKVQDYYTVHITPIN